MSDYYILEGKDVKPVKDVIEWATKFEKSNRVVNKTDIGDVNVSTVFLGLDHSFMGGGKPVVFETMIFGGIEDGYTERYSTWDEAEKGHEVAVSLVTKNLN